jgi:hypothetical protein
MPWLNPDAASAGKAGSTENEPRLVRASCWGESEGREPRQSYSRSFEFAVLLRCVGVEATDPVDRVSGKAVTSLLGP